MEYEGFKIDKDRLLELSHLFSEKIDSLTEEITNWQKKAST